MIRAFLMLLVATTLIGGTGARADAQTKAQSPGVRPAQGGAKPASTVVVNINTASAAEFESLPGVGSKTAALIVEYRQKNGPFKKLEELMNVRGLGEKSFLKLRPQLTLGAAKSEDHQ
jgi:competence protein ComEA